MRRVLVAIVPLIIIVVLGVVVKQIGPQRAELGKFKTEKEGEKAAVVAMSKILRLHPYANAVEVTWRGPSHLSGNGSLNGSLIDRMKYSRSKATLYWGSGESYEEGGEAYFETSCQDIDASTIHKTAAMSGDVRVGLGCDSYHMIQVVGEYE